MMSMKWLKCIHVIENKMRTKDLSESPLLVDVPIVNIRNEINTEIKKKKLILSHAEQTQIPGIMYYWSMGNHYFFHKNSKNEIDTYAHYIEHAVKLGYKIIKICQQKSTLNESNLISASTLNTMKLCSEYSKKPILTDCKHSVGMANIIYKMYIEKEKYGISSMYLYDEKTEKIITPDDLQGDQEVWEWFERSSRYMFIIDFFKYFKESENITPPSLKNSKGISQP